MYCSLHYWPQEWSCQTGHTHYTHTHTHTHTQPYDYLLGSILLKRLYSSLLSKSQKVWFTIVLLRILNCMGFVKVTTQNGFTFLPLLLLGCLPSYSTLWSSITDVGLIAHEVAGSHFEVWQGPILHRWQWWLRVRARDRMLSTLSPEVWEFEGPPAPFVLLL